MRSCIAVLAISLMACSSGPKEGQWYEHKGTRERIKISSVGRGDQLKQFLDRFIQDDNKITRETRGYDMSSLVYDSTNATEECVSFEKHHPGLLWWRWYIIPVRKLGEDYSLVE